MVTKTIKKCTWCSKISVNLRDDNCMVCDVEMKLVEVEVIMPSFWDQLLRKSTPIYKELSWTQKNTLN